MCSCHYRGIGLFNNFTDKTLEVIVNEVTKGRKYSDYKNTVVTRDARRAILKEWRANPETKMLLKGLKKDPEALKGWLLHANVGNDVRWAVGEYCKAPRHLIESCIGARFTSSGEAAA